MNLPCGGVPERPKGADCKSAVIDFEGSNPSPTTIHFCKFSKISIPLVGFPSGQREQTVNLPSSTSKVRILPPPPSFHKASTPNPTAVCHILPMREGREASTKVRFERQRESVAAGNDPKGEARSAESSFPHHHHFPVALQQNQTLLHYILPMREG